MLSLMYRDVLGPFLCLKWGKRLIDGRHRDRDRNREGERGERGQGSVPAFLHKSSFLNTASVFPF